MENTSRLLLIASVVLLGLQSHLRAEDWPADRGFSFESEDDLDFDESAEPNWLRSPFRWRSSNRPSAFRQLGTSTRRFFSRTREWFSFARNSDATEADEESSFLGLNRKRFPLAPQDAESEATSWRLFGPLFRRREPSQFESPHNWISLDRPQP